MKMREQNCCFVTQMFFSGNNFLSISINSFTFCVSFSTKLDITHGYINVTVAFSLIMIPLQQKVCDNAGDMNLLVQNMNHGKWHYEVFLSAWNFPTYCGICIVKLYCDCSICPDQKCFIGQQFYWSTILVLISLVWTDFTVNKCILGWGFNVVVFGFHQIHFTNSSKDYKHNSFSKSFWFNV